MSESKFTPGPWVVDESRHEGSINRLEPFRHIGMVSQFQYDVSSRAENEANAKLIAAAPDLLEMLKEARRTLEVWKDVAPAVSLCADIDKAIAKATE